MCAPVDECANSALVDGTTVFVCGLFDRKVFDREFVRLSEPIRSMDVRRDEVEEASGG